MTREKLRIVEIIAWIENPGRCLRCP